MTDTDPLTAELAVIRRRREQSEMDGLLRPTVAQLDQSAEDVPRLLDAVEKALALHVPVGADSFDAGFCGHCGYDWPCKDRQAITAALTGTDATS